MPFVNVVDEGVLEVVEDHQNVSVFEIFAPLLRSVSIDPGFQVKILVLQMKSEHTFPEPKVEIVMKNHNFPFSWFWLRH